jgi:hypothetical protein
MQGNSQRDVSASSTNNCDHVCRHLQGEQIVFLQGKLAHMYIHGKGLICLWHLRPFNIQYIIMHTVMDSASKPIRGASILCFNTLLNKMATGNLLRTFQK